uniref:Exonuclease domain-containing protein n=1 Tax=Aegilops tauschii subsp. strangulata TaxID=200361 RepID=A0A453A4T9_AEGTS
RPSVKQKSHAFCGDNNNEVTESYDHFVIVDLKATGEKGVNINPLEIIEFSSILVDAVTGQQASTFHTYVCPIMHPELSEFCKEYNGILQTNVEAGVMLSEALQMHQAWLKEAETKNGGSLSFAVVTWGDWDCRTILMQECSFKHVTIPYYFYQWINLKKPFAEKFGDNYLLAPVLEAVQAAGLKWKGCPKGGQSHADNKARLLELLIRHSAKLYITDNLLAM